jgi:hypothetical protein
MTLYLYKWYSATSEIIMHLYLTKNKLVAQIGIIFTIILTTRKKNLSLVSKLTGYKIEFLIGAITC